MERIYPYCCYNLRRPDMASIIVPDEEYDRHLDDEWQNPYGVDRGRSAPNKRGPGRPKRGEK